MSETSTKHAAPIPIGKKAAIPDPVQKEFGKICGPCHGTCCNIESENKMLQGQDRSSVLEMKQQAPLSGMDVTSKELSALFEEVGDLVTVEVKKTIQENADKIIEQARQTRNQLESRHEVEAAKAVIGSGPNSSIDLSEKSVSKPPDGNVLGKPEGKLVSGFADSNSPKIEAEVKKDVIFSLQNIRKEEDLAKFQYAPREERQESKGIVAALSQFTSPELKEIIRALSPRGSDQLVSLSRMNLEQSVRSVIQKALEGGARNLAAALPPSIIEKMMSRPEHVRAGPTRTSVPVTHSSGIASVWLNGAARSNALPVTTVTTTNRAGATSSSHSSNSPQASAPATTGVSSARGNIQLRSEPTLSAPVARSAMQLSGRSIERAQVRPVLVTRAVALKQVQAQRSIRPENRVVVKRVASALEKMKKLTTTVNLRRGLVEKRSTLRSRPNSVKSKERLEKVKGAKTRAAVRAKKAASVKGREKELSKKTRIRTEKRLVARTKTRIERQDLRERKKTRSSITARELKRMVKREIRKEIRKEIKDRLTSSRKGMIRKEIAKSRAEIRKALRKGHTDSLRKERKGLRVERGVERKVKRTERLAREVLKLSREQRRVVEALVRDLKRNTATSKLLKKRTRKKSKVKVEEIILNGAEVLETVQELGLRGILNEDTEKSESDELAAENASDEMPTQMFASTANEGPKSYLETKLSVIDENDETGKKVRFRFGR